MDLSAINPDAWVVRAELLTALLLTATSIALNILYQKYMMGSPAKDLAKPRRGPNVPTTGEGQPVNLVYGKTRVRNVSFIYAGTPLAEPVGDTINGESVIVAWRHRMDLTWGVCLHVSGGVDFTNVWMNERKWFAAGTFSAINDLTPTGGAYELDVPNVAMLDKSNSLGGPGYGGEMNGVMWFHPGGFSLTSQSGEPDGETAVNYRGIAHVSWTGLIGEGNNVPAMSFEVAAYPSDLSSGIYQIGDDANPVEVLYDILTNQWGRLGLSASDINTASFTSAAATLNAEGNGVSLSVTDSTDAYEVIAEILRQIDAVLYESPTTGQLNLKLVRDDYTIGNLDVFDESNVSEVSDFEYTTESEVYNKVVVTYPDRSANYLERAAVAGDDANYEAQDSKLRMAEIRFPFCSNGTLASKLAHRELRVLSSPLIKAKLVVNRDAFSLRPGGVFKFNWTEYGVSNIVMRIQNISIGDLDDGRIIIDCVQDVFAAAEAIFDPPRTLPSGPSLEFPDEATDTVVTENPWWYGDWAVRSRIGEDAEDRRVMTLVTPAGNEANYIPSISRDGGTTYNKDSPTAKTFVTAATVETAYARSEGPYDTTTGLRIEGVTDTSVLATATEAEIRAGDNFLLVVNANGDEEWMAYESYTDLGGGVYRLNSVWRGLLDTAPHAHGVGARVWFAGEIKNTRMETISRNVFLPSESSVSVKAVTTTGGYVMDEDDVTAKSVTFSDRAKAPYPVAALTVDSANDYPGDTVYDLDGGSDDAWVTTSEFGTAAWKIRIRNEEIQRGDDTSETISGSIDDGADFDIQAQADGAGSWTDLLTNVAGSVDSRVANDGTPSAFDLRQFGSGLHHFRVRTKRSIDNADVYSYQSPEVSFRLAEYRNLLLNPSFDDDGRAWSLTTISGTADFVATDAYRGVGKYATVDGDDGTFSQTVDCSSLSPVGKTALLRLKAFQLTGGSFGDGDSTVTATIEALDSGSSSLGSVTTGAQAPGSSSWDAYTLTYTSLPANTAKLKVKLALSDPDGGDTFLAVDDVDLRLADAISAEQLTNGDFDSLTGWNASNVGTSTSSSEQEGTNIAIGNSGGTGGTASMHQDTSALPSPITVGDIAHLRFVTPSLGVGYSGDANYILQARDSGGNVLDSATVGPLNGGGGDEQRHIYMVIPTNTDHFRFTMSATATGGTDNPALAIDDASLIFYDIT